MALLQRPRRGTKIFDVSKNATQEDVGKAISFGLRTKGYCLVGDACEKELLDKALHEVDVLDENEKLEQPNSLVQDGLLGSHGSARICELTDHEEASADVEALAKLDSVMTDVLTAFALYQELTGLACTSRSAGVLNQTGDSFFGECELSDHDADKWLTVLIRQKVLVLVFLGSSTGTLELEPHDDDAIPIEINTYPGLVVLLRTDQLNYSYFSNDTTSVLSCFFMQDNILRMQDAARRSHMTSAALAMEEHVTERLQELKQAEREGLTYGDEIPRNFILAMNHAYVNIDMCAVPAAAVKFPTTWSSVEFFDGVLNSGCDIVTEVPFTRWDHVTIYEPTDLPWEQQPPKTNCSHASFIDGVDLFDHKIFGLSPAEVKGMDPNQRLVLETSYEALLKGGVSKKKMLNSSCGVYVGTAMSDWAYADRTADVGTFGATGGAASITAGRLSFCLGLKGACLSIDTEAAASMTATLLASESVQEKGRGRVQEFALGIGTNLNLAKHYWPIWSAAGMLCAAGRCFSLNDTANGFVRSEGSGSLMIKLQKQKVDDEDVTLLDENPLGLLAGGWSNHNGKCASMTAPSAPSIEEALQESAKQCRIQALDVDSIEIFGVANFLADAVEACVACKALRGNNSEETLFVTASKTLTGNGVEMSGVFQLVKAFHATKRGLSTPNLHLRALNPHIDREDAAVIFPNERLPYRMASSFQSIFARGHGGANVNLISFGQVDEALTKPRAEFSSDDSRHKLVYWPSGGGLLDFESRPRHGYFISGSWNDWGNDQRMEEEGDGVYGFTITLDEKRWEQFNIMLDSDTTRLLHPGIYQAPEGTAVLGPDDLDGNTTAFTWFLDGRSQFQEQAGDDAVKAKELSLSSTSDEALPGTQFRIRLHVAGKWQTVSWSKCGFVEFQNYGRYHIISNRSHWSMENAIELEDHGSGLFRAVVTQDGLPLQFIILRNGNSSQAIFPSESTYLAEGAQVIGPADMCDNCWYLLHDYYPVGSKITIELEFSNRKPPVVRFS